jgi:hypothetical protein
LKYISAQRAARTGSAELALCAQGHWYSGLGAVAGLGSGGTPSTNPWGWRVLDRV